MCEVTGGMQVHRAFSGSKHEIDSKFCATEIYATKSLGNQQRTAELVGTAVDSDFFQGVQADAALHWLGVAAKTLHAELAVQQHRLWLRVHDPEHVNGPRLQINNSSVHMRH